MSSPITYLLLIRHGENDWVGTNRLAGRTPGVHLNDNGRQQADQLSLRLAGQPVSAIYSSPLDRCLETAQPVAAALGLAVIAEAGVQEVDYGGWQGGDLKELSKSQDWYLVQHYPSSFRFPDGETLREVQARSVQAVERIRCTHPNQLVAVFSHGDVIRTTLAHYMGTPLDLFQRIAIDTASISALVFHGDRPMVLFTNYRAELPKFEFKNEEKSVDPNKENAAEAPGATQTGEQPVATDAESASG
jgi:probable phosphoglycerate mutase